MKSLILLVSFLGLVACDKAEVSEKKEVVGSKVVGADIQLSQYFTYDDSYFCKTKAGKHIKSYVDSIYFDGEKVCRTGDICQSAVNCAAKAEVADLKISADKLEVHAFGRDYFYGADLTANGGLPDLEQERQVASIEYHTYGPGIKKTGPSHPVAIIIFMWIIAFSMLFFMHYPSEHK